jgi:hypothetical protein
MSADDFGSSLIIALLRLIGGVAGLAFTGFYLLVIYGVAVIVLRHAFGLECPNPFDWLPTEWRQKLLIH